MKKITDREMLKALAAQPGVGSPRDRDEFWSDFRARARMRAQDRAETERPRLILAWAAPLACAAMLMVAAGLYVRPAADPDPDMGATIKSIEVVASHSAVLIMEDEESESTVIWVAGMEQGTAHKDNT